MRRQRRQQASPAKFISLLFGGAQRRNEQYAANEDFGRQIENWEDTKMTNPYAGVKNPYADMENVYEDQTVDLRAAEFQKEQSMQSAANIMSDLKGAAGGSGVAGLAQVLANQGAQQAQQASASIGMQEQANQARARGEASRLQTMEREGEQKRDLLEREGARMVEQYDMSKQDKMLDMAMQRKGAADQAMDNETAQVDQFATGALTTGLSMLSDSRLKDNMEYRYIHLAIKTAGMFGLELWLKI
jgi:flagellar motor protein MotB